ncbi:MAG: hypothetical protein L6Q99_19295 [Planctomycetes bacterium]|nr:hypothetical protein [Planctomycetota bacterium]
MSSRSTVDVAGPVGDPARLSWVAVGVLVVALAACRLIALESFPIYDDAFITYRYAENLAHGQGLVYNPGAPWEPVLGTTTPLYALILSALTACGLPVVKASVAFNILCEALAALFLAHLLGRRPVVTAVALGSFAAVPQIARITVGGMEPPLLVALALAATTAAYGGRPLISGFLAALCCLVRPESLFLLMALGWMQRHDRRALVRFAVPVVVIGLVSTLSLLAIYGQPIPQSVVAKGRHSSWASKLSRMPEILAQGFGPTLPMQLLVPFAALGYLRGLLPGSRVRPLLFMGAAMVGAYALVGTKTWGWYYYVALVSWCIALGLGTESFVERVGALRSAARGAVIRHGLAPLLAVAALASIAWVASKHQDRITPRVYEPLADWAKEARLAERDVRVLASDIGAVGFLTGARILDSEGLVWPDALGFPHQCDVLRAHSPEYVVWVVNRYRLGRFLADADLSARYRPIRRFNENANGDLHPDRDALPESWEQDYLIFERVDLQSADAPSQAKRTD